MPDINLLTTTPEPWPGVLLWILASWLFAVGACIGSFLNVVILRLPAGISIAEGGSRCPRCRHAIRWYDNIPIISWLILRGRCRDCSAPIAIRYPVVELLVALLFLVLGWSEVLSDGASLPVVRLGAGHWRDVPSAVWSIYGYHLVLLATLLCAAVIQRDGKPVPLRLYLFALVVGITVPLLQPLVHPVPLAAGLSELSWMRALAESAVGLGLGLLLALAAVPLFWHRDGLLSLGTLVVLPGGLAGLYLGWQAVVVLLPAVTCGWLVGQIVLARRGRWWAGPWSGWLAVGVLGWLVNWRAGLQGCAWYGREASWVGAVVAVGVILAAACTGSLLGVPASTAIGQKDTSGGETHGIG